MLSISVFVFHLSKTFPTFTLAVNEESVVAVGGFVVVVVEDVVVVVVEDVVVTGLVNVVVDEVFVVIAGEVSKLKDQLSKEQHHQRNTDPHLHHKELNRI